MVSERLRVILELEAGQYKREAKEAATATGLIADSGEQTSTRFGKLKDTFNSVSGTAKVALAGAATLAVGSFVRGSIKAAGDLNESINAVESIFGDASDTIHQFGVISAQAAGLATSEFNSLTTVTGALLKNLGFSMDEAAEQSIRLTTRAADMASVFNTDVSVALEAINSGLKGEANPLEQFGVKLNDAAIRAKAVELGLADTTAAVDDHGKAVAALELIYEQTSDVQGDFLKTAGEVANAQRISAAEFENSQARFGQAIQAPLAAFYDLSATTLTSVTALGIFATEAETKAAKSALRMAEAVDTISVALANGDDPLTALADGLLHIAANSDLSRAQFEALAAAAGLPIEKFDAFSEVVLEQAEAAGVDSEVLDELRTAMTEVEEPAEDAGDAIEEAGNQTQVAADKTAELRDRQKELRQAYLEAADPIFGAVAAVDRFRDAQANLKDIEKDRDSTAEDVAEAQLKVAESALEAQSAIEGLSQGELNQGIQAIADALEVSDDEARNLLETLGLLDGKTVTTVVRTRFEGPQRYGGPVDGYGGRRASGGPVDPSQFYMVGERGPELFVPHTAGVIVPNGATASSGGSSGPTYVFNGDVYGDDAFMRRVRDANAQMGRLGMN